MKGLNHLWHPWERERVEYFSLRDLWNRYDEWSAYGAGVPITLPNSDILVQYYVPYLSTIQIFTSNTFRDYVNEHNDIVVEFEIGECEIRDSCNDTLSDESECEKLWRWDESSLEEGEMNNVEQDSHQLHFNDRLGHILLQKLLLCLFITTTTTTTSMG
ncbi:hypothetical protein S83_008822, partial [Arachis hypogaea]